jgi:hypothetical protein
MDLSVFRDEPSFLEKLYKQNSRSDRKLARMLSLPLEETRALLRECHIENPKDRSVSFKIRKLEIAKQKTRKER